MNQSTSRNFSKLLGTCASNPMLFTGQIKRSSLSFWTGMISIAGTPHRMGASRYTFFAGRLLAATHSGPTFRCTGQFDQDIVKGVIFLCLLLMLEKARLPLRNTFISASDGQTPYSPGCFRIVTEPLLSTSCPAWMTGSTPQFALRIHSLSDLDANLMARFPFLMPGPDIPHAPSLICFIRAPEASTNKMISIFTPQLAPAGRQLVPFSRTVHQAATPIFLLDDTDDVLIPDGGALYYSTHLQDLVSLQ